MLFSVIIPAYNAEKYIAETLSSIFSHFYENFYICLFIKIYIPTDNNIAAHMGNVKDAANSKHVLIVCGEEGMLKDLGATRFIRVEENLGKYLAYTASCDSVLDFNSLRLKETVGVDKVDVDTLENAYAVMSVSVPSYFKGRNIKDFTIEYMDDSQKIVGVYSPGSTKENNVHFCDGIDFSNHPLAVGDTLIICGQHEKLKKLLRNIPS